MLAKNAGLGEVLCVGMLVPSFTWVVQLTASALWMPGTVRPLYWGELGLVERDNVARAMVSFREALDANRKQEDLAPLALTLAHACRDELALSWGTEAWKR